MRKQVIVVAIIIMAIIGSTSLFASARSTQSVCTLTGLSGPALQENLLYCANGTNIAPSTYHESIQLAANKHIIVGTPEFVTETVDWNNCQVTDVEFTRGFHAEHHNAGSTCAGDFLVRIYDPFERQVWP